MQTDKLQPIASGPHIAGTYSSQYQQRWFLADRAGKWLSAADLSTLELQIRFGYLVIRAPGMLRLDIPLDVIEDDPEVEICASVANQQVRAVDEGALAGAWFSELLGLECKLLKVHPEATADFTAL